mgnify:CR=1 FL=1
MLSITSEAGGWPRAGTDGRPPLSGPGAGGHAHAAGTRAGDSDLRSEIQTLYDVMQHFSRLLEALFSRGVFSFALAMTISLLLLPGARAQDVGGQVVEQETGEPLPGFRERFVERRGTADQTEPRVGVLL